MYFAMNRFRVAIGQEEAFEAVWKARDSSLSEMPGFIEFHLLRGDSVPEEGYTPFISKSAWETRDAFIAWTKSDNFRAAHRSAGENKAMYLGPPKFEGFTVIEGA
ncbi:antibiotic biosynthesis monooxygenase [Sinorhizobium meliloti]|uniref:antibiotic biosynthesis monooxygenase family protein n=1 Tax=Rhizobium meliloti TaxID=382 RepID=UPI000FD3753D|nr:antibiotic biosynthesis monooxygenase [Sinorhizobium meliloti]MDW9697027.1 antibiotic biosynthesis monooxygenase [Sinorhizobium meliloti]MDW9709330.1 antibiotic biosynthesis monooxygenase [Sinorhizobium meliloti]MDW9721851.1 antibiotic biosynthesis monooxygenase [Sinorhizobium meliloti]MDW9728008.1 antibiotic biosynthesis monooxygenase [Sinorhizobium meliloti]MDW9733827.1 antibiotic biosynthesis monooxygenase [Sinorhizobium meliloti]